MLNTFQCFVCFWYIIWSILNLVGWQMVQQALILHIYIDNIDQLKSLKALKVAFNLFFPVLLSTEASRSKLLQIPNKHSPSLAPKWFLQPQVRSAGAEHTAPTTEAAASAAE
jgi:hypothetical protein